MTDLHLCDCDVTTKTHSRAVHERQRMMIALNLVRPLWNAFLIIEPPLGHKRFGIWSPKCVRQVNGTERDIDRRPFRDGNTLQLLA